MIIQRKKKYVVMYKHNAESPLYTESRVNTASPEEAIRICLSHYPTAVWHTAYELNPVLRQGAEG